MPSRGALLAREGELSCGFGWMLAEAGIVMLGGMRTFDAGVYGFIACRWGLGGGGDGGGDGVSGWRASWSSGPEGRLLMACRWGLGGGGDGGGDGVSGRRGQWCGEAKGLPLTACRWGLGGGGDGGGDGVSGRERSWRGRVQGSPLTACRWGLGGGGEGGGDGDGLWQYCQYVYHVGQNGDLLNANRLRACGDWAEVVTGEGMGMGSVCISTALYSWEEALRTGWRSIALFCGVWGGLGGGRGVVGGGGGDWMQYQCCHRQVEGFVYRLKVELREHVDRKLSAHVADAGVILVRRLLYC